MQQSTSRRDVTATEIPPEEQGVKASHQAPQPVGCAWGRRAPTTPGFENQWGFHSGKLKGCGNLGLCSLHTLSFTLTSSTEATAWKVLGSHKKEIHWWILRHVLEGQGSGGTSSGNGSAGRHHLCHSPPNWHCVPHPDAPLRTDSSQSLQILLALPYPEGSPSWHQHPSKAAPTLGGPPHTTEHSQ